LIDARRRSIVRLAMLLAAAAVPGSIVCERVIGAAPTDQVQPTSGDAVDAVMTNPPVRRALELSKDSEPRTIADQIRFCETAAPTSKEGARAELLKRAFVDVGLNGVYQDRAGNVIGSRPGAAVRPRVMLAAHLDTVFPEGTSVLVRRVGSTLLGPGIGDNCRGLAVLVAVARVLRETRLELPGSIVFVATVGEEGLGNLRGVRELFGATGGGATRPPDMDFFVSIDGPGLHVTNVAVGSHRYRVTFKGPGGHSFAAFGVPSPVAALSRAVTRISDIEVPRQPRTTFNVGKIGGGSAVNAIPTDAWMEVDLRSSSPTALTALEGKFQNAIDSAVHEENVRGGTPNAITATRELIGDRPAGMTSLRSPIVRTALQAGRALNLKELRLSEGSTDANIPISLGLPAITIGGGGTGADAHAPTESFDSTDAWQGTQHALLVTIALAQK